MTDSGFLGLVRKRSMGGRVSVAAASGAESVRGVLGIEFARENLVLLG